MPSALACFTIASSRRPGYANLDLTPWLRATSDHLPACSIPRIEDPNHREDGCDHDHAHPPKPGELIHSPGQGVGPIADVGDHNGLKGGLEPSIQGHLSIFSNENYRIISGLLERSNWPLYFGLYLSSLSFRNLAIAAGLPSFIISIKF